MFPVDLTLTESEFQKVGMATEKALVPICFNSGNKSRLELDY